MPSFNMYVYGSLDAFMGILNAVAMVFNQSGFMNGVYLLGGLFMLVTVLVQAAGHMAQPAQIIRNIAIYATLISVGSIPTSLTVQDIYSGQLNKVDNVPMMLALPATVTSTALYGILDKTSTAYQGADASYVSISQGGFMDPLKQLLAMRTAFSAHRPLADTIRQFTLNCWNNAQAGGSIEKLLADPAGFQYFLTNGSVPNWTVNYINAANKTEGDAVVCKDAADKIWAEAQTFISRESASGSPSLVDQVKRNMASIGPRIGGGVPNLTTDQMLRSTRSTLDKLDTVGANSQDQMLTLLSAAVLDDTFACIQKSGSSPAALTDCATAKTMVVQAGEQWKVDAAGNASFFQGIMLPASIFLQMLAIALFPLIFIVAVLSIGKAIQLLASFIVLMVWSMSWLPVAASVQWIMQMVLNADLRKFKVLNYENVFSFYNTVSTDLAIGADLISATPLIALAVLLGSPFAMAGLASRWSADRVNEKIAAPDITQPSSVHQMAPQRVHNAALGTSVTPGQSLPQLQVGNVISEGLTSSKQNALTTLDQIAKSRGTGWQEAESVGKAIRHADSLASGLSRSIDDAKGLNSEDRAQLQTMVGAGINAGIGSIASLKANIEKSGMSAEGKTAALKWAENHSNDFKSTSDASRTADLAWQKTDRFSQDHNWSKANSEMKSYQDSKSLMRSIGINQTVDPTQLGDDISKATPIQRGEFLERLAHARSSFFAKDQDLQNRTKKYSAQKESGAMFGEIEALYKSSNPQYKAAAAGMMNALYGGGVSGTGFRSYQGVGGLGAAPSGDDLKSRPAYGAPLSDIESTSKKVTSQTDGADAAIKAGADKINNKNVQTNAAAGALETMGRNAKALGFKGGQRD